MIDEETILRVELLRRGKGKRRPTLKAYLDQYNNGSNRMRTVFTIEIATDIGIADDKRRLAFIALTRKACKTLFAQTAMLSDSNNVEINMQTEDSMHGCQEIALLDGSDR